LAECPYCEAQVSHTARKCKYCGEWIQRPVAVDEPEPQVQHVVHHSGSVAFAVVTLLFYIFFYPVGLLLNVIGLFTGPRKGCFGALLIVFFLIPFGAVVLLASTGVYLGVPVLDQFIDVVRSWLF